MIKQIIFDVGNVLAGFEWEKVFERLFPDREVFRQVADATVLSTVWDEFDRSEKEDEEIIQEMLALCPHREQEIRLLMEHVGETVVQYDYSIPWILELKKRGFGIYILSNYPRTSFRLSRAHALTFLEYVDGAVFSYEERSVKPEPKIYERLLEKYGLNAQECLFLDDKEINIKAAQAVGMKGIVFQNQHQARTEMEPYLTKIRYPLDFLEKMMFVSPEPFMSEVPLYSYCLKQYVNGTALEQAVNTACDCYPLYRCRMVKADNDYFWEENPLTPSVYHVAPDQEFVYGNERNNFYPWIVIYHERKINYHSSHALGDGESAMAFMATVLYYYFEYIGEPLQKSDGILTKEELTPEHIEKMIALPYESVVPHEERLDRKEPPFCLKSKPSPTWIPEELYIPESESTPVFCLCVNLEDVYRDARDSEVTGFAVLGACMIRAMDAMIQEEDSVIRMRLMISFRKMFQHQTFHNFSSGVELSYERAKFKNRPDTLLYTALRGQLDLLSDKDLQKYQIFERMQLESMYQQNPDMIHPMVEQISKECVAHKAQYIFTYLTNLGMPEELMQRLEDIYGDSLDVHYNLLRLAAFNVKGKVNVTIEDPFKGSIFTKNLEKELNRAGIGYVRKDLPPRKRLAYQFLE